MKTTLFTKLLAGSLITATFFTACSKSETTDELNNGPQQTTTETAKGIAVIEDPNILNQELKVTYARDGATDITWKMDAFTLKFVGNYPSGEGQVWNDLLAQTGTWKMASESSITISYPTILSQLAFFNRNWTIGNGIRGYIVFTADDGDEVHFISRTQ